MYYKEEILEELSRINKMLKEYNYNLDLKIVCGADGIEEKTIQKYITVPERDMFEADNRILWGEKNIFGSWTGLDNLGFINQSSDFIGMFQENKYRISDEYFNILTNDLAPTVVQNIADYRDSEWGGLVME